jgi:UDP-glucuronate 4-epimerase
MTTLVTGVAGFIGFHVVQALLAAGERVIGIDNLNSYYDVRLKHARLKQLVDSTRFTYWTIDISDAHALAQLISSAPDITNIAHLAAQAGVRYSLTDPYTYVQTNVMGHVAVLETARRLPRCEHVVYASSSSVYGGNDIPFSETDRVDRPQSVYAATKRSGELISEAFAHLYGLPQTGLRFFTVYGPWGRPDMAYFRFADDIMTGRPISLFEGDNLMRDFTFIGDAVNGVLGVLGRPPIGPRPHRVLNLGNNRPERVIQLVRLLEDGLGRKANIRSMKRPRADVEQTHAVTDAIERLVGLRAVTNLPDGIAAFLDWYRDWFADNGVSSGEPFGEPAT